MRLIQAVCPSCGALLKCDLDEEALTCAHCGASLVMDEDAGRVFPENAKRFGYELEMGRRRAAADFECERLEARVDAMLARQDASEARELEARRDREQAARRDRERAEWLEAERKAGQVDVLEARIRELDEAVRREDERREEVRTKTRYYLRHWLWALLWPMATLIPMVLVVNWLFGLLPGSPSVRTFEGWLVWYALFTFPIPLEVCLDLGRKAAFGRRARYVAMALVVLAYLAMLCPLASMSAESQRTYLREREAMAQTR